MKRNEGHIEHGNGLEKGVAANKKRAATKKSRWCCPHASPSFIPSLALRASGPEALGFGGLRVGNASFITSQSASGHGPKAMKTFGGEEGGDHEISGGEPRRGPTTIHNLLISFQVYVQILLLMGSSLNLSMTPPGISQHLNILLKLFMNFQ